MNHPPRTGFRLIRRDRDPSCGPTENSVHYTRFQPIAPLAVVLLGSMLAACASQPEPPPAPAPVRQAPAEKPKPPVELAPRAPERYVVKKGDTLWDISTMFLEDPWLWPEIWYTNPQIENPHLIFPGDIITIFWKDGRPHLQLTRDGEVYQTTLPIQRLSPQVRTTPLADAIPTIPIEAIRPFLTHPRIMDEDEYEALPYVLRSQDGRLLSGAGDSVYVRGIDPGQGYRYQIVRKGDEYEDPETGDTLGFEAMEVGQGVIRRHGDPATLFIEASAQEALRGDRLVPVSDVEYNTNFLPTPPDAQIKGQIIDVVNGVSQIGQYMVVTINRGAEHGLDVGDVLDIYQRGGVVEDEVAGGFLGSEDVQLPDQQAGTLLVFRVFDNVAYGLVMRSSSEIHVLDMVRNP